jgi:hypothetical protein
MGLEGEMHLDFWRTSENKATDEGEERLGSSDLSKSGGLSAPAVGEFIFGRS